jgi:hypothetical protein
LKDKINRSELEGLLHDKCDKHFAMQQEERIQETENKFDELELSHSEFQEEMRGKIEMLVE